MIYAVPHEFTARPNTPIHYTTPNLLLHPHRPCMLVVKSRKTGKVTKLFTLVSRV